jgi:hypothetical protein
VAVIVHQDDLHHFLEVVLLSICSNVLKEVGQSEVLINYVPIVCCDNDAEVQC